MLSAQNIKLKYIDSSRSQRLTHIIAYIAYIAYVHNHIIIIKKSSSVAFKQPALHLCDLWCPRKKSRKSGILAALELIVSIYNFPQVKDFVNWIKFLEDFIQLFIYF